MPLKKILLTLFAIILFLPLFAGTLVGDTSLLSAPKIDKRVELLSIVFRLAGNQEYNGEEYKQYTDDIHKYFDKFKDHPVVALARELRDSNGVSYDAVMALAIHLEQPPSLKPLVAFSDSVPEPRWGAKNATKFISLLQKFYADADCEKFFKQEADRYKLAEERFRPIYNKLDLAWYKKYYGQVPDGKFHIVIGLSNGGSNYGCKVVFPNKKEAIYAIMGTWSVDSLGKPKYALNDYFPTLIHEFNHSFVNFLIEKNLKLFEKSGPAIYDRVVAEMRDQAYGEWKTMINEALVRGSVIEYLRSHDSTGGQAKAQTMEELGNNFLWIKQEVALLDRYQNSRQTYPTLESFIPQIAVFYDSVATNIDSIKEDYKHRCPHVTSIVQFKNNATDVDPALTKITVNFDKPLSGKGYSIGYGKKGKETYPELKVKGYSADKTAVTITVALQPGKEYQFTMLNLAFKTPEGYPLEPYEIDFTTRK
jgi:hypothetical protein